MKINLLTDLIKKEGKNLKKRAIIFENERFSYGQLQDLVDKFAHALMSLRIEKGDKVGILLRNCPEYVISFFGILKAGAIAVPLNFMLKEEELKPILEDSEVKIVISKDEFYETLKRLSLRIESLERIILVDASKEDTLNFYTLINKSYPEQEFPKLDSKALAVLLYTSGTTGKPKGVMLTHKNFISNIESCLRAVKFSTKERIICLLPLFHSFALTVCLLLPLYIGATSILLETMRPFGKVVRAIIKNRVTIFVGIPQIYNVLIELRIPWFIKLTFIRKLILPLRFCISGAAPLSMEVLAKFEKKFRIPLLEGYGLTEASPVVSLNPSDKAKPGSVGKSLPGVEVKVIDNEGKELPPDVEGELIVRGENVMLGYYRQEQETKETIKHGWLYTQDIARIDNEGYIYILDRKKDLIIVRGLNVYPREIEDVIYQNSKVKEACVIGVSDESKGEVPKAFVVVKEGEELTESELLKYLRTKLASYKIPKYIEFKTDLPKTPTGKISRKALK